MRTSIVAAISILLFLLLSACKKESSSTVQAPTLTAEDVEQTYDLYLSGRYADYVKAIASCDDAPESHRRQMVNLLRLHAYRQKLMYGGTRKARVTRLLPSHDGQQTNAFLRVDYNNRTHEEILLSFVYLNHRWRLR